MASTKCMCKKPTKKGQTLGSFSKLFLKMNINWSHFLTEFFFPENLWWTVQRTVKIILSSYILAHPSAPTWKNHATIWMRYIHNLWIINKVSWKFQGNCSQIHIGMTFSVYSYYYGRPSIDELAVLLGLWTRIISMVSWAGKKWMLQFCFFISLQPQDRLLN